MNMMNLVVYGSLALEVLGILICLKEFLSELVHYHFSKKYYKLYSKNVDLLISDMIEDGSFESKEDADTKKLMFAMEMQMIDCKKSLKKPIIGLAIMVVFLIKTITMM